MGQHIIDPPNQEAAYQHVGRFLYHFALLEQELDRAIRYALDVDEDVADILAANIDFGRKLSILRSAIQAQPKQDEAWKSKADAVVNKIFGFNEDRKVAAHSPFMGTENKGVVFFRNTATKRLKREILTWTEEMVASRCKAMKQATSELERVRGEMMPVVHLVANEMVVGPYRFTSSYTDIGDRR